MSHKNRDREEQGKYEGVDILRTPHKKDYIAQGKDESSSHRPCGNIPGKQNHDPECTDTEEDGERAYCNGYSEPCGHSFSSPEPQKGIEDVPKNNGDADYETCDFGVGEKCRQVACCSPRFGDIDNQDRDTRQDPCSPKDIGKSDIPASVFSNILLFDYLDEKKAGGDCSDEPGEYDECNKTKDHYHFLMSTSIGTPVKGKLFLMEFVINLLKLSLSSAALFIKNSNTGGAAAF